MPPLSDARRRVAWALVGAAAIANLAALALPFMSLRMGLSREDYGLFHTVRMLVDGGMWPLAAIVVAFSLVFPFFKLGALGWITAGRRARPGHLTALGWIERLGRWSLLDVYIVCALIALCTEQWLVGAQPRLGLACFTGAVVLSMLAGEVVAGGLPPHPLPTVRPLPGWTVLALRAALLGTALTAPFLRIDDWLLSDRSVGVVGLVLGPAAHGAPGVAAVLALTLVAVPLLALAIQAAALAGRPWPRLAGWCGRWNGLDVFAAGLAIVLIEADSLMSVKIQGGAAALVVLLIAERLVAHLRRG
jgi:uncharacterized paraquat-inducible protein A